MSTKRTIYAIMIGGQGGRINIQYEGTGFLYHMVRILTGTLLEVGMGTHRIESVTIALEARIEQRLDFWLRQEDYSLTKSIIRRSPGRRNRLKLISWNVMVSGHAFRKDSWISFMRQMRIFSVFRRRRCRKDS